MLRHCRRLAGRRSFCAAAGPSIDALATDDSQWPRALAELSTTQWQELLAHAPAHSGFAAQLHKPGASSYVHLASKSPELLEPLLRVMITGVHATHPESPEAQEAYLVDVLRRMATLTSDAKMVRASSFVATSIAPTNPTQASLLFRASFLASKDKAGPSGAFHFLFTTLTKHDHMEEAHRLLAFAKDHRIKPRSDHLGYVLHQLQRTRASAIPSFLELTLDVLGRFKLETNFRFWHQSLSSATAVEATPLVLQLYEVMRSKRIKPRPEISLLLLEYFHPRHDRTADTDAFARIYDDAVAVGTASPAIFGTALDATVLTKDSAFVQRVLADMAAANCTMDAALYNAALRALAQSDDAADAETASKLFGRMEAAGVPPTTSTVTALAKLHRRSPETLRACMERLAPAFAGTMASGPISDPASHCAHIAINNLVRFEKDPAAAASLLSALQADDRWRLDAFMVDRIIRSLLHAREFALATEWLLAFGATHDVGRSVYEAWFAISHQAKASLAQAPAVFAQWRRSMELTVDDYGLAIYALCQRQDLAAALDIYSQLEGPPSEKICVALMKALHQEQAQVKRTRHQRVDDGFKRFFRIAIAQHEARAPTFHAALNLATAAHDADFVAEVIDATVIDRPADAWRLDLPAYNKALCACAAHSELHTLGLQVYERMHAEQIAPDELTMMACVKMAKSFPASAATFGLLEDFRRLDRWPTIKVYTAFLEILAQNEQWADCDLLLQVLEAQGVALDLKAATLFGCVFAQQRKQTALLELVAHMHAKGIAPDALFLREILARLAVHWDIDMRLEFCKQVLTVARSQVYYLSTIELCLSQNLLDRALNLVVQMECDGFTVDAAVLVDVIDRAASTRDMEKVVSVVAQLMDGDVAREVPFGPEVLSVLLRKCAAMQIKTGTSLQFIRRQAAALGYPPE
ncbi:hypothetical protein ACHHYP_14865 [Achlya hypogyna]|uniref:Pentacotripeptide-repeat region of PRORP domain-containing protein n=1 Tax=Achlya hypogyna TaxID=1202772 RepID=A0A1V9YC61_ACHHY|nr:hypothetical protein ACHHYP_14865 [Achlya hypogyna]